jgi:hypothetical protein
MLNSLSELFDSIGVHPIVGGVCIGALLCALAWTVKTLLRIEVRGSAGNELARFRDPDAFSRGTNAATKIDVQTPGEERALPDQISSEVMKALRAGKKIEAIKLFRESSGLGLKESKDFIEALQSKLGL